MSTGTSAGTGKFHFAVTGNRAESIADHLGLVVIVVVIAAEVVVCGFVSAAEAIAVVVADLVRDRRLPELPSPVHVGGTMVFKVVTAGFDAVVETLPSDILEFGRRRIPVVIVIPILNQDKPWIGLG
jgi:hypothetical protein